MFPTMSNSISYLLLMYEDNNRHFCNCFKRFWHIGRVKYNRLSSQIFIYTSESIEIEATSTNFF